jgi:hypothetical protein
MATKVETSPAELLKHPIPIGHWRFVNDDEQPAAVAALAKVIGRESKQPSWQRRLAVKADGSQFLIVIDDCPRNPGSINWNDTMPEALKAIPTALPVPVGVQLLQSDASPEKELDRRRALAKKREDEAAERQRAEIAKSKAEAAERQRVDQERADFRADAWTKLGPLERFVARLALAVERHDPILAAGIRAAIDAPTNDDAFPRGSWWQGLDKTLEAIRVAEVFETMPGEMRALLKVQHGNNPSKVVAAYEAMRAQNVRAAR